MKVMRYTERPAMKVMIVQIPCVTKRLGKRTKPLRDIRIQTNGHLQKWIQKNGLNILQTPGGQENSPMGKGAC